MKKIPLTVCIILYFLLSRPISGQEPTNKVNINSGVYQIILTLNKRFSIDELNILGNFRYITTVESDGNTWVILSDRPPKKKRNLLDFKENRLVYFVYSDSWQQMYFHNGSTPYRFWVGPSDIVIIEETLKLIDIE